MVGVQGGNHVVPNKVRGWTGQTEDLVCTLKLLVVAQTLSSGQLVNLGGKDNPRVMV